SRRFNAGLFFFDVEDAEILWTSYFFFTPPATTVIYTLSLHDALPILTFARLSEGAMSNERSSESTRTSESFCGTSGPCVSPSNQDRKSTRLNSSHVKISYAVFCLKKKKKQTFS